jgi:hypothetical protein
MRSRERKRPDRRWLPWSATGLAAGRSLSIKQQPLVEGLEARYLLSSVHLKPPSSNPSFTDLGLQLNATGALAGLGNGDVLITITAHANQTATCTNPSGANQPPGQNPAPVTVMGSESIPASEVKNGNVTFNVTTEKPPTTISPFLPNGQPNPQFGCPNPNWTETVTDLQFKDATITVEQGGIIVFTDTCTFSPSTSNGPVPNSTVTCMTS